MVLLLFTVQIARTSLAYLLVSLLASAGVYREAASCKDEHIATAAVSVTRMMLQCHGMNDTRNRIVDRMRETKKPGEQVSE